MIDYEVATDKADLGKRIIAAGNIERLCFDFRYFLPRGTNLTGATATVTSAISTVGTPTLSAPQTAVYVILTTTAVVETFTLALRITTNDGQIINYTAVFEVVT